MAPTDLLPRSLSILLLSACLLAQGGAPPPVSAAPAQAPAKGDELRRAFVDADGGRRTAISDAALRVLAADKAGRAQFMATLRAIAAMTPPPPAPTPTPTPAATPAPASTPTPAPAPAKPPEFADEIKKVMAEAIGADAAAQKTALEKLAADKDKGALTQLDERGKLILARCVREFIRKRMETNAMFAGQYVGLRDFHPEGSDLLLKWAKEGLGETANPEQFRTACLRALRDTLTADQATDRVRADLRELVVKAQSGPNRDLLFNAVCALLQYGDSAAFDKMTGALKKQSEVGTDEEKQMTLAALAELHYQARQYDAAAGYYASVVSLVEKAPEPPPGLPTMVYNTACCQALAGKTADALKSIEKALELSAKSDQPLTKTLFDTDHDIESLRKEPRFQELYEKHFGKPAKK